MNETSTNRSAKPTTKPKKGIAERLLLVAILALGVIGLAVSYGGKSTSSANQRASARDSTGSSGKIRKDHMILNLNQRHLDTAVPVRNTRF